MSFLLRTQFSPVICPQGDDVTRRKRSPPQVWRGSAESTSSGSDGERGYSFIEKIMLTIKGIFIQEPYSKMKAVRPANVVFIL